MGIILVKIYSIFVENLNLKENAGQMLTTQEIINCINLYEPDVKPLSIIQYCSNMSKALEIGVEEGKKNKYYYIGTDITKK